MENFPESKDRPEGVWLLWNQALASKMAAGGADLPAQAELLERAGQEARERGDRQALWAALNGLSKVRLALQQVEQARLLATEALGLAEELFGPDSGETGTVLSDLVFIEALQGRQSLALALAEKLLLIALGQASERFTQAFSYNISSLATFHTMRGDEELTERIFWRVIAKAEESPEADPDLLLYAYKNLGDFYHAQGRTDKEGLLRQRALDLMERAGYPSQSAGRSSQRGGSSLH